MLEHGDPNWKPLTAPSACGRVTGHSLLFTIGHNEEEWRTGGGLDSTLKNPWGNEKKQGNSDRRKSSKTKDTLKSTRVK